MLLWCDLKSAYCQYKLHFTTYTTSEDLPSGSFSKIIKSPNGFVWLLSENGITKFDGYDFTTYFFNSKKDKSLSSTQMLQSYEDSLGNLFFSSKNALFLFDSESNELKKILTFTNANELAYFGSDKQFSYALLKNNLYTIRTNPFKIYKTEISNASFVKSQTSGLLIEKNLYLQGTNQFMVVDLQTKEVKRHYFNDKIKYPCFLHALKNKEIIISANNQLFKYDLLSDKMNEYPARPCEKSFVRNLPFLKLSIDGSIYSYNREGIITKLNLISGEVSVLNLATQLNTNLAGTALIYNISKGVNNNLWVENNGFGLVEIDLLHFENGIKSQFWNKNSSIPTNNCTNILEDKDGLIWFLSVGKGLIKTEKIKTNFTTIYPGNRNLNTPNTNIRSLCEYSPNKLAIGALEGSFLMDIGNNATGEYQLLNTNFYNDKLPISNVTLGVNGTVLLSNWQSRSLMVIDPAKETSLLLINKKEQKDIESAFRCSLNEQNSIYFGTANNSIYVANKNSLNSYNDLVEIKVKRDRFSNNMGILFCLKKYSHDKILIGSRNGLYEYCITNDSLISFKNKIESNTELLNTDIRCLHLQDSNLWIGTNGDGLVRLNLFTKEVKNYKKVHGLSDDFIYTLLEDHYGKLWMGTNAGINSFDPSTENFQFFSRKDGVEFSEFNTNAACQLSNGQMAFGGVNGFVLFHPDSLNYTSKPFPIFLTHIYVNNISVKVDTSYFLNYDQNYLSFQFAALTYLRNEELQYAYKMTGLDDEWISSGNRRFTTYANLLPGTYHFLVRCTDPNGMWNKEILKVSITIKKPWFKEWYAYLTYSIIVLSFGYSIYHFRRLQRLKLQAIRDNIARDLHDEIGSNLSSISIFNEVAKESAAKNADNLQSVLNKIGEYAQISQEGMNDIVWMIDSKNERFENIFIKMRTLAAETIGAGNYVLSIHFDESLNGLKLPMGKRKNFYLIFKEAINNLLKYSHCTHVSIKVQKSEHFIFLTIEDDGIGFILNETRGNGLTNMRKRAQELNGELSIDSSPNKGTRIHLKFRL